MSRVIDYNYSDNSISFEWGPSDENAKTKNFYEYVGEKPILRKYIGDKIIYSFIYYDISWAPDGHFRGQSVYEKNVYNINTNITRAPGLYSFNGEYIDKDDVIDAPDEYSMWLHLFGTEGLISSLFKSYDSNNDKRYSLNIYPIASPKCTEFYETPLYDMCLLFADLNSQLELKRVSSNKQFSGKTTIKNMAKASEGKFSKLEGEQEFEDFDAPYRIVAPYNGSSRDIVGICYWWKFPNGYEEWQRQRLAPFHFCFSVGGGNDN